MTEQQLIDRLRDMHTAESGLAERKVEGVRDRDIRKTVVAFANSTPENQEAVLFIGVHDKTGAVIGVSNTDALQKRVTDAIAECYPPISVQVLVVPYEGKAVVAVVVPASTRRPHFSGSAYVRQGSLSLPAPDALYEELILSRNDLVREMLKYKAAHTIIAVRGIGYRLGSNRPLGDSHYVAGCDCTVSECTAFRVSLYDLGSQQTFSESIKWLSLSYDDARQMPMLIVSGPR